MAVVAALVAAAPAVAQQTQEERLRELERRVEALTRELERERLGRDVVEADTSMRGFGPAASKVYRVESGVSLGGYGEVVLQTFANELQTGEEIPLANRNAAEFDALRAIIYVGYKFNDRLLFNSEIEIEHADEAFLEFAYVDYLLADNFGVRGGLLLLPVGLVNELHEPSIFLGTTRPLTETVIIPTTWRENGIGVFGDVSDFSYRLYAVNGLRGAGFSGAGLRGGRQKGSHALADDFGFAGRLDYQGVLGLMVGGSAYIGDSGQNLTLADEEVDAPTRIFEVHADYNARGVKLRGLFASASLDDVEQLNTALGLAADNLVGERLVGWYVQGGYDVGRLLGITDELLPYVRYESVNTQAEVQGGATPNPAFDRTIVAVGAEWKPLPNVVVKTDYQIHSNEAETGVNQLNAALGWIF